MLCKGCRANSSFIIWIYGLNICDCISSSFSPYIFFVTSCCDDLIGRFKCKINNDFRFGRRCFLRVSRTRSKSGCVRLRSGFFFRPVAFLSAPLGVHRQIFVFVNLHFCQSVVGDAFEARMRRRKTDRAAFISYSKRLCSSFGVVPLRFSTIFHLLRIRSRTLHFLLTSFIHESLSGGIVYFARAMPPPDSRRSY